MNPASFGHAADGNAGTEGDTDGVPLAVRTTRGRPLPGNARRGAPAVAANKGVERVMGIEPTLVAWEATVLPLNYTRTGARE
jgi:hypothetical protein